MSREIDTRLEELAEVCQASYRQGMVCGSGGNASFRQGDDVYITPTGYALGRITPADIVRVSLDGTVHGPLKPSRETGLHLCAYRSRPDIAAVLHVHSFYSVAAGILAPDDGPPMPPYTPGYLAKLGTPALVPCLIPGSEELACSIERALVGNGCVLMKNHGVILVGKSLFRLFDLAEELEANARIHMALRGAGALDQAFMAAAGSARCVV